ncbi:MAG TPA: putative porin, partial [Xanthomonadales bacterium]|nr:putative porin [Xanthomonadales bacterium]
GKDDRNRNRIRARALLAATVSDTMMVGLGLATGGEDPVSTNQTIGGGGSKKSLSVDLAYFEWSGLENTVVLGGKFKQQHRSAGDFGLLWDSDWRPEGTSIKYDNGLLYAVGLGTWIESDSSKSQQEFSYGLQAGTRLRLGDSLGLNLGAGYFRFDSKGKGAFFGDDDFFGNSFDPVNNSYLYDYHEVEGFAELGFNLFDRPVLVFADYVQNLEADDNNTGYAFGINYNDARKKGTWELNYAYKKLEADAVLGLLTDSDFGGGGTNVKGSVFSGAYAFHDNWNFQMTYFINQTSIDGTDSRDFDRLMLDLQFKYK